MERAVAGPFGRTNSVARMLLAATIALGAAGMPEATQAQGLIDILRGIFDGQRPPPQRLEPPRLLEGFPRGELDEPPVQSRHGPRVAYCVRLCDGRYFPLPRNAGTPSMSPEKVCSAMCPAAETRIFSGNNISRAADDNGKNYTSIENAFLFRDRLLKNCTCTGESPAGVASMDAMNDATLRRGDVVMTSDGPMVFAGDRSLPHKPSDFKPAEDYKGLPKSVRQQLSEMRVGEEIRVDDEGSVAPAELSEDTPPPVPDIVPPNPAGPHASLSYAPAAESPVANAFLTFKR